MSQLKTADLMNIADGVAFELFHQELQKVAANIADPNTKADKTRAITLTVEFRPDENREEVKVHVHSKAKLVPIKGYSKTVHCGKMNGQPVILTTDPKQLNMFADGVSEIKQAAQ